MANTPENAESTNREPVPESNEGDSHNMNSAGESGAQSPPPIAPDASVKPQGDPGGGGTHPRRNLKAPPLIASEGGRQE